MVTSMNAIKCLVQLFGSDGLCFVGRYGEYTPDIQSAIIFSDELEAQTYIDRHGLNHLARIRRIVKCTP